MIRVIAKIIRWNQINKTCQGLNIDLQRNSQETKAHLERRNWVEIERLWSFFKDFKFLIIYFSFE